jgi:hypothetical protein
VLDLLSVLPEPYRFVALTVVAFCLSYFCAKILAGIILKTFNVKLLSENNGEVSTGFNIVRKAFWITWTLGFLTIMYAYYLNE